MNNILLSAQSLSIGYGSRSIVSDLELVLEAGKVVSLLGANGAGKSTLLKTLTGELPPISGKITVLGKDLLHISRRRLAQSIAIVTTDRVYAGGLTVRETVGLGRQPYTGFMGHLSSEDIEIITQSMRETGIIHKADAPLSTLSDGERQKVMIARAIAQRTPVIILDEPFSFIDPAARIEIFSLLRELSEQYGTGILLSSHDVFQSLRMSDEIWLITSDSRFIKGSPTVLSANGAMNNLFRSDVVEFNTEYMDFIARK